MAIIGSIRKRSSLLLIIIGVAILLFVLGDIFGGGVGATIPEAGTIAGESVDANQLEKEAVRIEALYTSYGSNITRDQARKQAWSEMVRQRVYYKGIEESGISMTDAEYDDARWGSSVLDEFTTNERYKSVNGQFSADSVQKFYAALYTNRPDIYIAEKKRIRESRLSEKFNNLVSKGVYYNDLDAKDDAMGSVKKVSFQFITKKYSEIADSTIATDDAMLRAYYNEHKNDKSFEQDESRNIEYITFAVLPTTGDEELIKQELRDISDQFKNASNDSTFVLLNSDNSLYAKIPYQRGSRTDQFEAAIINGAVGNIVGPYKVGNTYKLAKVVSKTPKDESKVRHILLKSVGDNDDISNRADSILRAWNRGGDFDVLAARFSEDPGFASNKGVYDWFDKDINFVPEFKDFSFDNSEGTREVVKTTHGYHVMEVMGRRSEEQSQIIELMKNIVPSKETFNIYFEKASNFTIDYGTSDKFNSGAEELGYTVEKLSNLRMSAQNIGPVNDAREAVRWAYNEERTKGDISEAFDIGEYFLVLKFIAKREKGVPEFEDCADKVERAVIKEEKAKQISALIADASDLEAAGAALGKEVNEAPNVAYNATGVPGAGSEPLVVGTALSLGEGEVSRPIEGTNGIFMIKVLSRTGELAEDKDLSINKSSLMRKAENTIISKIQPAMNEAAGVINGVDKLY